MLFRQWTLLTYNAPKLTSKKAESLWTWPIPSPQPLLQLAETLERPRLRSPLLLQEPLNSLLQSLLPIQCLKKQTNKSIHTWHVTLKTCFRPKIQLRQNNYTRLHDISYLTRCCLGLVRTCKRVQIIFRVFSLVRVWVCCSAGALTSFCHVTGLTGCLALGGLRPTKPWNIWNLHGIQNHHFEAKIMIIIKMLRASLFKAM